MALKMLKRVQIFGYLDSKLKFAALGKHRCFASKPAARTGSAKTAITSIPPGENEGQSKPLPITDDGIYKRHGYIISSHRTMDNKPFFPGKRKWYRVPEGQFVQAGSIVCLQKKLDFHPGLQVGMGRDLTLFAMEAGVVYITWEKIQFNWKRAIVEAYYGDQKEMTIYKPYYHVISEPQPNLFKLVSRV